MPSLKRRKTKKEPPKKRGKKVSPSRTQSRTEKRAKKPTSSKAKKDDKKATIPARPRSLRKATKDRKGIAPRNRVSRTKSNVSSISEIARAEGTTKAKRLPTVKSQEKRRLKRVLPKLRPGWKRYIESAPEDRIAYTFRIEAVVEMRGQYNMSFRAEQYDSLPATSKGGASTASIQMLHTRFTPTIQEAVIDLREKKLIMEAYGGVQWLTVDLYRVSGYGPMREKHFKLLGEYDEPEDVPGF